MRVKGVLHEQTVRTVENIYLRVSEYGRVGLATGTEVFKRADAFLS